MAPFRHLWYRGLQRSCTPATSLVPRPHLFYCNVGQWEIITWLLLAWWPGDEASVCVSCVCVCVVCVCHSCVCVCVCVCVSFCEIHVVVRIFLHDRKGWNVQCKLNAILFWNIIGEFWIRGFIVELWCDLLTIQSPAKNNRHLTVQSIQQIRWQPGWNPENETAKATQPKFCLPQHTQTTCNWSHGLIWHPPLPDCVVFI